ncbi:hypothetical protein ABZT06_44880 [Streptomyces sp. NPDC005483]|uniref:hypothetical protein n=1 Tax=Streptomyces sp. NPDC005483 TaxID=3154882 RepID=UPI00339E6A06
MHALLTHPDQMALLREGVIGWPDAVEAGLHWNAPLRGVYLRYALRDTDIHVVTVRCGEPILVALAAAHPQPAQRRIGLLRPACRPGTQACLRRRSAPLPRRRAGTAGERDGTPRADARYPQMRMADSERSLTPLVPPGDQRLHVTDGRPGDAGERLSAKRMPPLSRRTDSDGRLT